MQLANDILSTVVWPAAFSFSFWALKQGVLEYLKVVRERTIALQAVEAAKAAVVSNVKLQDELRDLHMTVSTLSNAIMQQR